MTNSVIQWRNEPATEAQLRYIMEMHEMSDYPIPVFKGKTKGEASDYIKKNSKIAHQRADKFGFY